MRSLQKANDFATTFDVIEEVLFEYEKLGKNFNFTCCIYACAPFVSPTKLESAFNLLQTNNFDSVFPVMTFGFPIQRALKLSSENKIDFFYNEFSLTRSQDLEKSYHDAGQFYWLITKDCIGKGKIITDNSGSIVISELEGQDIDNEVDWKLAELKYELLQSIK